MWLVIIKKRVSKALKSKRKIVKSKAIKYSKSLKKANKKQFFFFSKRANKFWIETSMNVDKFNPSLLKIFSPNSDSKLR